MYISNRNYMFILFWYIFNCPPASFFFLPFHSPDQIRDSLYYMTDEVTLSDHNMISYSLPMLPTTPEWAPNYSKTNWKTFLTESENFTLMEPLVISPAWLDKECQSILQLLTQALEKATPPT